MAPILPPSDVTLPTGRFLSPDKSKTTRTDFTAFFLSFQCPQDASPFYKLLFTTQQELLGLLINHPAMEPNKNQTFDTPPNSKNPVYLMWDFLRPICQILVAKIDPKQPQRSDMIPDVKTRTWMATQIILDEEGTLKETIKPAEDEDPDLYEVGDEIKALARKMEKESWPAN